MSSEPAYRPGETIPGTQYRYVRSIGAGGHGCVYEVEHAYLEARAVMKLLHGDLADRDDLAQRMTREARTLAKLRHPNIVEVRDGGLTSERPARPYFVMESLHGMSLRDLLRKTPRGIGALPAVRLVADLLVGLEYAHRAGVIHRDIKPDNIFLHRLENGVSTPKILDFGIAHLMMGKRLTGQYFLGTPRYASPEQLRGDPPSAQTDIYAAGLVLFELLTGQMPYAKLKDVGALCNAHLNERVPAPSTLAPDVPSIVDGTLLYLLEKDPAERPPNAFSAATILRELRARLEADQSASMHSPEFATEPSPMDGMLLDASPDDPPFVTEVAPPEGENDTTPDGASAVEGTLREKLVGAGATVPLGGRAVQNQRTVPMAQRPSGPPEVDRDARTRTAPERARVVAAGPNATEPSRIVAGVALVETTPVAGARRKPASVVKETTNTPVVVSSTRSASTDSLLPPARRSSRRFVVRLGLAAAAVVALSALVTATIFHGSTGARATASSTPSATSSSGTPAPASSQGLMLSSTSAIPRAIPDVDAGPPAEPVAIVPVATASPVPAASGSASSRPARATATATASGARTSGARVDPSKVPFD